jgi:hypothetical protein
VRTTGHLCTHKHISTCTHLHVCLEHAHHTDLLLLCPDLPYEAIGAFAVRAHGLHRQPYGQVGVKPGELAAHGLCHMLEVVRPGVGDLVLIVVECLGSSLAL